MNNLEMSTYVEPDFSIFRDEFINTEMSEEEKERIRKKTEEFYKDWTDDDYRDLGNNY